MSFCTFSSLLAASGSSCRTGPILHGLLPHLVLNQHLVGRHPDPPVPGLPVPGPGDPEVVVIHVDKVKGEQPEEESTDPAGELEELQGHSVVVLVLQLHLERFVSILSRDKYVNGFLYS